MIDLSKIPDADMGEVLSNGSKGWVYCPKDGEFDAGGFAHKWEACRFAVRETSEDVKVFEGGDGCSIHIDGKWFAFGNIEENAWISAYNRMALSTIPDADILREAARRQGLRGGRPKVMRPCPKCGEAMGALALKEHVPRCGRA